MKILSNNNPQFYFSAHQNERVNKAVCGVPTDERFVDCSEREACTRLPGAGVVTLQEDSTSASDDFFSMIHEKYLQQAQKFRSDGYNQVVPEIDQALLTQLQDVVNHLRCGVFAAPATPPAWQIKQFEQLEKLVVRLKTCAIWYLSASKQPARPMTELEKRSSEKAHSRVRWVEDILNTLISVAQALNISATAESNALDNGREVAQNALMSEFEDSFAHYDDVERRAALKLVMEFQPWEQLVAHRAAMAFRERNAILIQVAQAARDKAREVNKPAWQVKRQNQSEMYRVSVDVVSFLNSFSLELKNSLPPEQVSMAELDMRRVNKAEKPEKDDLSVINKSASYVWKVVSGVDVLWSRLIQRRETSIHAISRRTTSELITEDSAIRSVLWLWQQPASDLQRAGSGLKFVAAEMKKIGTALAATSDVHDTTVTGTHNGADPVEPWEHQLNIHMQAGQWMKDKSDQMTHEGQKKSRLQVLKKLLKGNVESVLDAVTRAGAMREGAEKRLRRDLESVRRMAGNNISAMMADVLLESIPDVADALASVAETLKKAADAAGGDRPDYCRAEEKAERGIWKATRYIEKLSTGAASVTGRPLDGLSRGSRLALHWASLAKKHYCNDMPQHDAAEVLALLEKHGLLQGTRSSSDPRGYLLATRLAAGLEAERDNRLNLPMTPAQYTALEKEISEFIVKWGQDQVTKDTPRLVVNIVFEGALMTLSLGTAILVETVWQVAKAAVKIPLKMHKVHRHTMPGQARDYDAVLGMLNKKLNQLGFKLLMTPVPKEGKLAFGGAVTAFAAKYNWRAGAGKDAVTAVYENVKKGEKSQKFKLRSPGEMVSNLIAGGVVFGSVASAGAVARAIGGKPKLCGALEIDDSATKHVGKDNNRRGKRDTANSEITSVGDIIRQNHANKVPFSNFTTQIKKSTYLLAIKEALTVMEKHSEIPENVKKRISLAMTGAPILVPVDINGHTLNHTFIITDGDNSRTGTVVFLKTGKVHLSVNENMDFYKDVETSMPYGVAKMDCTTSGRFRTCEDWGGNPIDEIKAGKRKISSYFNKNKNGKVDIDALASQLTENIVKDYKKGADKNNVGRLIPLAVRGTNIPVPVRLTPEEPAPIRGLMPGDQRAEANVDAPISVSNLNQIASQCAEARGLSGNPRYEDLSSETQWKAYHHTLVKRLDDIASHQRLPVQIPNGNLYDSTDPRYLNKRARRRAVVRNCARDALGSHRNLFPVDINGIRLHNIFFIPDQLGAKTGWLVNVNDTRRPGVYVHNKAAIPPEYFDNVVGDNFVVDEDDAIYPGHSVPFGKVTWRICREEVIVRLKAGFWSIPENFNTKLSYAMDVPELSKRMAEDYSEGSLNKPDPTHNQSVISQAILAPEDKDVAPKELGSFFQADNYQSLTENHRHLTYKTVIIQELNRIAADKRLNELSRIRAKEVLTGLPGLSTVKIAGITLFNTVFLSDVPGSKSGVIIKLDKTGVSYKYIEEIKDIPHDFYARSFVEPRCRMVAPFGNINVVCAQKPWLDDAEVWDLESNFNRDQPAPATIDDVAQHLDIDVEELYEKNPYGDHNKAVFEKAAIRNYSYSTVGFIPARREQLLDLKKSVPGRYFELISSLGLSEVNHIAQIDVLRKKLSYKQALKRLGTIRTITTITGAVASVAVVSIPGVGVAIGTAQSLAHIAAKISNGDEISAIDIADVGIAMIPAGKIHKKLGTTSKISAAAFKTVYRVAGNVIYTAQVLEAAAKAAMENDFTSIFHVFVAAGFSATDSLYMAKKAFKNGGSVNTIETGSVRANGAFPEKIKSGLAKSEYLSPATLSGPLRSGTIAGNEKQLTSKMRDTDVTRNTPVSGISNERSLINEQIAKDIRLNNIVTQERGDYKGTYQVGTKHYISIDNKVFAVKWDKDNHTLRMNQGAGIYHTPIHFSEGRWRVNPAVGLKGGARPRDNQVTESLYPIRGAMGRKLYSKPVTVPKKPMDGGAWRDTRGTLPSFDKKYSTNSISRDLLQRSGPLTTGPFCGAYRNTDGYYYFAHDNHLFRVDRNPQTGNLHLHDSSTDQYGPEIYFDTEYGWTLTPEPDL